MSRWKILGTIVQRGKACALLKYEHFGMLIYRMVAIFLYKSPVVHKFSDIVKQILWNGNRIVGMLNCSLHICYYIKIYPTLCSQNDSKHVLVVATTETCWNVVCIRNLLEHFMSVVFDKFLDSNFIDIHSTSNIIKSICCCLIVKMIFSWTTALSGKWVSHIIYNEPLHPVWCTTTTVIRLIPFYETINLLYFELFFFLASWWNIWQHKEFCVVYRVLLVTEQ